MNVFVIIGIALAVIVGTCWLTYEMIRILMLNFILDILRITGGDYEEPEE